MFPYFSFIGDLHMATQLQLSSQLVELGQAMSRMGVSANEMISAVRRMNEVLSRLQYHSDEITAIKDSLHDLRYNTDNIHSELRNRITVTEMELSDLRSAMDAKTENPNQNDDLEIFSQIEVNPFLPNFIDLDSEEYLNQRPVWNFTVDF